ncbi:MAG: response regulator [SAR324 cluster bacterium]|nr:response regulator [SAR324 cluster bacterium]
MQPVSVLFVDDEEDIRFILGDRFEGQFPLAMASSGVEALEVLKREKGVGVVVTDIRMPKMDGFELIRQARGFNPDLGFIVVSGHGDYEDVLEALRLGARNYLRKPYEMAELAAAIRQEIRRYEILREEHEKKEGDLLTDGFLTSIGDLCFEIPSDLHLIIPLAFRLVRYLEAMGFCDEDERGNLALALVEIITNAVEHGNFGITGQEKIELNNQGPADYRNELERRAKTAPYANRKVRVVASLNSREAVFRVEDEGEGFDFENLPDPTDPQNLFLPSGRGILLARTFLDEVEFQGKGNVVVLVKRKSSQLN